MKVKLPKIKKTARGIIILVFIAPVLSFKDFSLMLNLFCLRKHRFHFFHYLIYRMLAFDKIIRRA